MGTCTLRSTCQFVRLSDILFHDPCHVGYLKWKPIPDPLPGVNRPVYWGTEILQQAVIGMGIGFVFAGVYWVWKERAAKG